jgi:hypothetical protein
MILELRRQWIAGDPSYVYPEGGTHCGVCGHVFEEPSVVAWAQTDGDTEMGVACWVCVQYLGKRNPRRFPTIEEYRELLAKYPEAMYPSEEAFSAAIEASDHEDPEGLIDEASLVWRPQESTQA